MQRMKFDRSSVRLIVFVHNIDGIADAIEVYKKLIGEESCLRNTALHVLGEHRFFVGFLCKLRKGDGIG